MTKEYDLASFCTKKISRDEIKMKYTKIYDITGHELFQISEETDKFSLVMNVCKKGYRQKSELPFAFQLDRHSLLTLASLIIRELNPTQEDVILATLQRIEQSLNERPK